VTVRLLNGETRAPLGFEQVTDASGVVLFENVPEGHCYVEATATKHKAYTTLANVSSGTVTEVTAFLPIESVRMEWTVRPTQIADQYDIQIQAVCMRHTCRRRWSR